MTKILINDDEQSIRNTLREILEYEKYKVEEAKNGQGGLDSVHAKGVILSFIWP